ncbi:elongation factor G [Streptomyces scabiei]|uniref:elongation factor G n=2 Tax=Streptomyces scabiei TaxID=1930 RepID=UPI001B33B2D1|nr:MULTISPECIES: TetM/TetW/TetO/TetS family tetracycline resistance ribosomal protection protein [Streptomyces]MBP5889487.1 TetM/TetW/TetO/TetS family tetracycline resistance ribosomal protection protein [Streptomyces sp. LBUM 1481]MBP5919514.1 TetM/TetW/TetO/TetS family tetracycline resistance ribosomal protection protein [Streptomyces sp. LBUM 1483]MDX2689130.1 TetM/TetW/TetO/TetS family tetracycline resistance ribosomal protection protein [Streptomyces scabiei]MDX2753574.1 TetM/TetW/TetO/Tet
MSRILNLGILAHVDAGKTSLTERLLHTVGVIDEIGSVDDGSTRTDTLALERRRGITIKSAVVSFEIDDLTVNLIDTPGHPDFIAEVERVLDVLDGAVLVVSAVEGVQAQTRVLMRTLRRLRIPTLVFVNKVDRRGARHRDLLESIAARLDPAIVSLGEVAELGTPAARFTPYAPLPPRLLELLAEHDEDLLAAYVDDGAAVPDSRLREALAAQTGAALVHPVFHGSAITGAGIAELVDGISGLLPATDTTDTTDPTDVTGSAGADTPPSATVFKVERGPAGEKIAYVRMFAGTVRVRDRLPFRDGTREGKVTGIGVFEGGGAVRATAVRAGRIARLWGLADIRIGDTVGTPRARAAGGHHFAPPTLETVVLPARAEDAGALHVALTQLAEQDPLIGLRHDELRQELSVSLYGEVQKEVVQATLADEYGLDVTFRETTPLCVERLAGCGAAVEYNKKDGNPFLATVGLRVEPAPAGAGVGFRLEVELGSMPYAFFKAVEDTVRETLEQGLHGWRVPDCTVTLTHCGYSPRQSHAHQGFDKSMSSTGADFRGLTPLVLMDALRQAGTRVHEPVHRFRVEAPADTLGALLPVLAALRAVPRDTRASGAAVRLEGLVPAARVHELEQRLPGPTNGEGELETAFDHFAPVAGPDVPARPRTDHNPLDRKEYLLNLTRRLGI